MVRNFFLRLFSLKRNERIISLKKLFSLNPKKIFFVDLRSRADFFKRHIAFKNEGFSVNIPFNVFFKWDMAKEYLRLAEKKVVVLYGLPKKKLLKAVTFLRKKGFDAKAFLGTVNQFWSGYIRGK